MHVKTFKFFYGQLSKNQAHKTQLIFNLAKGCTRDWTRWQESELEIDREGRWVERERESNCNCNCLASFVPGQLELGLQLRERCGGAGIELLPRRPKRQNKMGCSSSSSSSRKREIEWECKGEGQSTMGWPRRGHIVASQMCGIRIGAATQVLQLFERKVRELFIMAPRSSYGSYCASNLIS